MVEPNLGESEETLSDRNNILHLLNRLDAVLDNLGVLGTGRVQDILHALDVTLSPVPVRLLHRLRPHRTPLSEPARL